MSLAGPRLARVAKRRVAMHLYPRLFRLNFEEQARRFYERAQALGHGDLRAYSWYHTIDLGQGLITPGTYDYRKQLSVFRFPDMRRMNVLDIGSATGFFAFEFERRGAHAVSTEVPSIDAHDHLPFEDTRDTLEQIAFHTQRAGSAEDVYHHVVDGPFKICHGILGSQVERHYSTVYELADLGQFDLAFMGDVLLHTIRPVEALAAVAKTCKSLIISQRLPERFGSQPAALYVGHNLTWWIPNRACLEQLLKSVGFREVELVGYNSGVMRPSGVYYDRAIVHARK